jgi:succinate dehydrogenase / fumarate reductase iron-sulfur subunit
VVAVQVRLRVRRFDPEGDRDGHWQDFEAEVAEHATVLDALLDVRDRQDETLALRCSCRSHICGSCAMRINGRSALACKTKVAEAQRRLAPEEPIRVEPAANMPVVKDLVVDLEGFFGKVRAVAPYLQPTGPEPEREYIVPNEAMLTVREAMACILCAACMSACTVLEVDGRFLGPAPLAKAWRFVEDPRDGKDEERLQMLSEPGGIWDCTHCFQCVEVCPKDVRPMDRILELRRRAMEAGFTDNNGSRHSQAFVDTIAAGGRLDETRVAMRSLHGLDEMVEWAGVGVKSLLRGKVPLRQRPIPGARHVRAIVRATVPPLVRRQAVPGGGHGGAGGGHPSAAGADGGAGAGHQGADAGPAQTPGH